MLQLIEEATGRVVPAHPVWEHSGRYYDAQRPSVEPSGLDSADEVVAHRQRHLAAVRRMLRLVDVFVFTMGLTEAWLDADSGTVYPTAPGTIAGKYDPERFLFKNFTYGEVKGDFLKARRYIKRYRPDCRFILTVSPVPLTATATGSHVLRATTYSKSVLRAVAGDLHEEFDDIDYFPSYEIITNPAARSSFFESNLRSVSSEGVESVMRAFFSAYDAGVDTKIDVSAVSGASNEPEADFADDVVCEEMLLDAFAR
ncbi:hypothetical protein GCM10010994_16450 [Chelatococcus reniformis]|uniref:GSCFA domain-containing protein n=1 Tax=Chelatococcus reniformis TaxID=1494448 RepID=A0A916U327_9HYPH|nr:hypothetical protein GCM10010994_16450 [Chelatococcus reniformis]